MEIFSKLFSETLLEGNKWIIHCLLLELRYAEIKFPSNEDSMVALQEEVGELAAALLEHKKGNDTVEHIFEEAIQVAAMAMKIAKHGDSSFPYKYNPCCVTKFFEVMYGDQTNNDT